MARDSITFRITGITPLLMHNGQLADPTNQHARKLTAAVNILKDRKREKTDADFARRDDAEWEGGLYYSADMGPYIPGSSMEAGLREAGGKAFDLGVVVSDTPLGYKGPREIDALRKDPRFRDKRCVKVKQNKVVRIRPLFQNWTADVEVLFNSEDIDRQKIIDTMTRLGKSFGIGDYTPKFGRFTAEVLETKQKRAA